MESNSQEMVNNIKQEIEDEKVLDQFTVEQFVGNVKHEPERHFVFIMPDDPEPEDDEVKEVKIILRKFDRFWKVRPGKMFKSYFVCGKCDFATQSSDNLRRHLRSCKVIKKCEKCFLISKSATAEDCGLCDFKFDCKNCKRVHTAQDHHKESRWHCTKCDYTTINHRCLRTHYKTHVKKFSCEHCNQKFAIKFQLKIHQQQHRHGVFATESENKFECNKCIRSFATRIGLKGHKTSVHSKLELHCDICGKIFKRKEFMRKHVKAHFKVQCPICQQSILGSRIKEHVEDHFSSKFKCDACDKVYLNKRALNGHKKSKHEINQVQCDLCSKIFQNKYHLRGHMQSHLKISCPFCNKLMTKETLKGHTKRFHSSSQNFVLCKFAFCKQKFENNEELKEHEEIHIGPNCYKYPKCNIKRHIKKC